MKIQSALTWRTECSLKKSSQISLNKLRFGVKPWREWESSKNDFWKAFWVNEVSNHVKEGWSAFYRHFSKTSHYCADSGYVRIPIGHKVVVHVRSRYSKNVTVMQSRTPDKFGDLDMFGWHTGYVRWRICGWWRRSRFLEVRTYPEDKSGKPYCNPDRSPNLLIFVNGHWRSDISEKRNCSPVRAAGQVQKSWKMGIEKIWHFHTSPTHSMCPS